jgi:hypothetical protein
MISRFYEVLDDVQLADRWHLGDLRDGQGREVDPRLFTIGRGAAVGSELSISITHEGTPLSFTFAAFDAPVVARPLAEAVQRLCPDGIQLVPVRVQGQRDEYSIMNVLGSIECLDESHSIVMRWKPSDGRPDKVGKLRQVARLALGADLIGTADLFRVRGWEIALIASERMRDLLLEHRITGVKFVEVETRNLLS